MGDGNGKENWSQVAFSLQIAQMDEDYDKEWNIFTPTLASRLRRLRCDQVFVQVFKGIIMSRSAIQV